MKGASKSDKDKGGMDGDEKSISSASGENGKFSKWNSTVLNKKPTFKINNYSIKISDSLKILGIVLDNKFTLSAHILILYDKTLFLTRNFNRIIKTGWSPNKNLLKAWYLNVIEKALLYGPSVWDGALTKLQIDRLHSIQRIFLLKFARAYRTTYTSVLNALSGIAPLHVVPEAEYIKFQVWARHSNDYNNIIVYTDGTSIYNETGFAVCILQNNINIQNHLYKFRNYNSVFQSYFQSELTAIHSAASWAAEKNTTINIYTDSLSSIAALKSASARSGSLNNIKQDLSYLKHLVEVSWFKALIGIQGNELTDQQAKLATTTGVGKYIPAPRSYVK
ncbi:hypothetical protein AVEN_180970-1 [Araneus ventricosus]|uniref:RNase H type-1 domain-containing protein n=1 Tax=Araneus ventricosus TaxID=182803 RepID=A0A4Y2FHK7_ARAVE|nr:hypothetical protein AVEN_180970-1 [Araneus ventricosus]